MSDPAPLPRIRLRALRWRPHLPPVEVEDATPEQLEAMKVTPSAKKVSPYVRTLAHDPESYVARTTLFNAIMYAEGGLPRPDRELGALGASLGNGCQYCANVHARQHHKLSGSSATIAALWTGQRQALSERDKAILAFAEALTQTPPAAGPEHIARLRDCGMDGGEIIDLIHSIAIFGWANRLMHPLGQSEVPESVSPSPREGLV
ncbi:MAG: peroxidase-related enzyme [Tropicimonas sp.]|uniref:peroxidase-related enzyme n=1 Tax=Tropicimonas sp. TaxID=2067044 RepID=UPI003A8B0B60